MSTVADCGMNGPSTVADCGENHLAIICQYARLPTVADFGIKCGIQGEAIIYRFRRAAQGGPPRGWGAEAPPRIPELGPELVPELGPEFVPELVPEQGPEFLSELGFCPRGQAQ